MAAGRIPTTANSPITAKGDLFTYSTAPARLAVGANDTALVADSAQTTGLNYKTKGEFNGLTTTGDTIYSSSGTTQSRLGIGSAGQVLTVASGIPSWATPASGGKLLAVVQASYSGQIESTTTTYADTGLTATTAALATTGSRVKIDLSMFVSKRASNAGSGTKLQLLRGSTVLTEITADVGYTGTTIDNNDNVGFTYIDSPATVSATTYKVQYANVVAASGVFFSVRNTPCYIQLSEIGA